MSEKDLIEILDTTLDIQLPATAENNLQEHLSAYINYLIEKDFQKLVYILYKTDVDENKLKLLLQNNENENASVIIAKLIIERELKKIETRKQFKSAGGSDDAERW